MKPEYDQTEVEKAFHTIKAAMKEDCPEEPGSYAHGWHCNIACMCMDAMDEAGVSHERSHEIGNDAASRFMKLCFDVDTKA